MYALKLADTMLFLSTLSLRRATRQTYHRYENPKFLSTLSLRRATSVRPETRRHDAISIHALLAESDFGRFGRFAVDSSHFYPRSPCGERPCRVGTSESRYRHFYPRSPCGERLKKFLPMCIIKHFYPRSPCGERRGNKRRKSSNDSYFYPRSPCGERQNTTRQNTQT